VNTHVKRAIIEHALSAPNEEICGLIFYNSEGTFIHRCPNVSGEPHAHTFEIAPSDYAHAAGMGQVCGIYHSHVSGAAFSEEDLLVAREMELPIYLYAVAEQAWATYVPSTYNMDPVGKEWSWGTHDCYEAVRTYYRQKRGIYLGDYDRDESFEKAEESAIVKYIAAEGFDYVPKSEPILLDDVLLFKTTGRSYPHHLGVLVGPNKFLHHPRRHLSRIDALDGYWLRRLVGTLRYQK
jgi:proteasome lid subunit RPN8/RPN11